MKIYKQIPLYDDCIGIKDLCGFLEIESQGEYFDEWEEPFIIFADVPIDDINTYMFMLKRKFERLERMYGQFFDLFLKPIFVFKNEGAANLFLRIYEGQPDKVTFIANIQNQYNHGFVISAIPEKAVIDLDQDGAMDLFSDVST